MKTPVYKCLNPTGIEADIERRPLCPRRPLKGGAVYLLDIGRPNSDVLISIARKHIAERLPDSELIYYCKEKGYRYDESEQWWDVLYKQATAVILFVGDCGSGTMRTITLQNQLESHNIPTVSLVCTPFIRDAAAVSRTLGRPSLRWTEIPYPITDISNEDLENNIVPAMDALVAGLTAPLSAEDVSTETITAEPQKRYITEGTLEKVQAFFSTNELSDGLPVIPPTDEAVAEMLRGTSHAPEEVVGKLAPEYLTATVEKVAINAVMCGCRPEHMPILLTICETLADEELDVNVSSRSTTGFAYWAFVNGPAAREIGMNASTNALGPGNLANASIGRAVRMFINNLGGSRVGINEMATMGTPLKYGFAFAENEEECPWSPYHVDKGFARDEGCVTVCESWCFRTQGLTSRGKVMGLQNILWSAQNVDSAFGLGKERGIMILLDPLLAKQLAAQGYTKADVSEYMWKNLTRTVGEWKENLSYSVDLRGHLYPAEFEALPDDALIPKFAGPENIQVVVVGGKNSPFYQIYDSVNPYHCVTKSIEKWR